MNWARKGTVHLLAALLLISLLGMAGFTSTRLTVARPVKIETWLADSKLYDNFAAYVADQGIKAAGSQASESVSLNNPEIRQAANSSFSPQLLKQSVDTFLNSNYDWLNGKIGQPTFVVDLSGAKQNFAAQLGQYAKDRLTGLPVCTNAQLAELSNPANIDPLTAVCKPAGLDLSAVSARISQQVASSDGFLSDSVITAQTINPKQNGVRGEPYYQKLSNAPKAYRLSQKLPFVFALLALLSTLGIVALAQTRRRGLRRVGFTLLTAGILLVAAKFVTDYAFKQFENKIFNNTGIGQIQHSLVAFLHRAQHEIISINFYFGTAFLLLAAAIFIYLYSTRAGKGFGKPHVNREGVPVAPPGSAVEPETEAPETRAKPPKPPRLVQ